MLASLILQDANFVKQIVDDYSKQNGVNVWILPKHYDVVNEVVTFYNHNDSCTVVVHLHPEGRALIVDNDYVYNPRDAWGYNELMVIGL